MTKHIKLPANAAPGFPPGWKVFPVAAGTKEPAIKNWPSEATDNRLQIEAWQIQFPGCNWGLACGPSGLAVIDVDPPTGEDSLFAFELEHGHLPPTREHRSARGGRHLIYRGDIAQTASKLGPKIDTRGGYILIPPSTFEGKPYVVLEDRPIADLPKFVRDAAGHQHERKQAPPGTVLDEPANVARAIEYLRYAEPATEGSGGDDHTYKVAAVLHDLGISEETALDLMEKHWNGRSVPPWPHDELAVKVANGYRYAQNEAGANAVLPVEQRIPAEVLDRLIGESKADGSHKCEPAPGLWRSYFGPEISLITPPRWLIKNFIPTPGVGIIFGKFGSFKTAAALGIADGVIIGGKVFDRFDTEQGDVVLVAGEGLSGLKNRVEAQVKHHGRALDAYRLLIVPQVPHADHADDWLALTRTIEARGVKPKIILADHLSIMLAGQDQNDATVATQAMQMLQELSAHFNCAVLIIAHAGKDGEREVRGSSAFLDNVDFAYELTRTEGSDFVKVRCAKMRDGDAPEPFHLQAVACHGAIRVTIADRDDARRAAGKRVGLRAGHIEAGLIALQAFPGAQNGWNDERGTGGFGTRPLGEEIARMLDPDGAPARKDIDSIVTMLNRGVRDGSFDRYIVRRNPNVWAVTGSDRFTGVAP